MNKCRNTCEIKFVKDVYNFYVFSRHLFYKEEKFVNFDIVSIGIKIKHIFEDIKEKID